MNVAKMSGPGNIFYPRPKSGTKRIDADGKEVEVEVREDEEQKVKLQEIIDLLVAAGYFRARIKGFVFSKEPQHFLTKFLPNSTAEITVPHSASLEAVLRPKSSLLLFFRALTEKIVAVLPEMKCPHAIEPHQIQGLDFIHIFPVIQPQSETLNIGTKPGRVEKIVEMMDERRVEKIVKMMDERRVEKIVEMMDERRVEKMDERRVEKMDERRVEKIVEMMNERRVEKIVEMMDERRWLVKKSVETRQEMGDFTRSFAINQFDKHFSIPEERLADAQQENVLKNIKIIKEVYRPQRRFRRKDAPPDDEESRVQSTLLEYGYNFSTVIVSEGEYIQQIQRLMRGLASTADQEGRLTAGVVGNIVNLQATELTKAAERYAELQSDIEGRGGGSTHSRALATLQRQKVALEEKEGKLLREKEHLETSIQQEAQRWNTIKIARKKVEAELGDLEKLETEENQGILRKLQGLVVMNESLKQQEQEFREQCKAELSRLQNLVKEAQENATPDKDSDQVDKQFEEERERVHKLRLLLAKGNRSIASLQRQLDEVPGRAELAQYQRRFLELYNQVAAKHKETKQFYTLYNTLDDTKMYLGKELSLLNSILDTYTEWSGANQRNVGAVTS
uniref:Coiled-coil domain-containing protein 93 n=1 Tax=Timema tahoe TaxID=61484 RepID=A0A7R9IIL2_9NEOP|nr:unnamed protein product [Timema tahoe]